MMVSSAYNESLILASGASFHPDAFQRYVEILASEASFHPDAVQRYSNPCERSELPS